MAVGRTNADIVPVTEQKSVVIMAVAGRQLPAWPEHAPQLLPAESASYQHGRWPLAVAAAGTAG